MTELYYLQDSRDTADNKVRWWAKDSRGYTTDLRKAQQYTRTEALQQHQTRKTDLPWPVAYIQDKAEMSVTQAEISLPQALSIAELELPDIEQAAIDDA